MTLSANTVWEVRTTGSDSNGGGFVNGASGTDYSQQDAAQFSSTDLVVDATTNTKVTSASHNFVSTDVGNLIQITAGTGWTTGFYQIVSVASNAATLDRSPAAVSTTGGTWAEGGAAASINKPPVVGGNIVYAKKGTYTITTGMTLGDGNIVPNVPPIIYRGYNTTRDDITLGDVNRPTITTTSTIIMVTTNGSAIGFENFILTTSGATPATQGVVFGGTSPRGTWAANILVSGIFSSAGINTTNGGSIRLCRVTGMTSGTPAAAFCIAGSSGDLIEDSLADGNTACVGFGQASGNNFGFSCVGCISTGNKHGFYSSLFIGRMLNCIAHKNTFDGLVMDSNYEAPNIVGCLFTQNGRRGINAAAFPIPQRYQNLSCGYNGFWNNVSGPYGNIFQSSTDVVLTGVSPYADSAPETSLNFALNATAGAGALLRGIARTLPGGSVSYRDIGLQHQDSGGGSSGGLFGNSFNGGML